jgi:hypothetical protein
MEPAVAVGLWLLNTAVAPDAYTRVVNIVRSKTDMDRLRDAVKKGGLHPSRRYRRWLKQEQTWVDLVARRQDAYDRLVVSLAEAEARRLFKAQPQDLEQAGRLVEATIAFFLPSLDASMATAVLDFRSERRHEEILGRLDANQQFEERLPRVPPVARDLLSAPDADRALAARVVDAVVLGDPRAVIQAWGATLPTWLAEAPAHLVLAVGHLAAAYGLRSEAADFYHRTADLGLDAGYWYARAAFEAHAMDRHELRDGLRSKVSAVTTSDPRVAVILAALDEDWATILEAVDEATALSDPFVSALYAFALGMTGAADRNINHLERTLEAHPEQTSLALRLAMLLLERSSKGGTTSRDLDRRTALELALSSRDLRREWRGDSGEAVEVACRAAMLAGDFEQVLRIARVPPEGEALPEEAAHPEALFSASQAAIASGQRDLAEAALATMSGFRQALIKAELLDSTDASREEVEAHYEVAWALASDEEDRVMFWLSASMTGIRPLPGQDELDQRDDDIPILCRASDRLAHGALEEAISTLRPVRTSESVRRLLVNAYMRNEDIDAAVAELLDMAVRFDNVEHRIRAVGLLAGVHRLDEACQIADSTLAALSADHAQRALLHEVGVAAAHNRQDWAQMEARTRAWINDLGPDRRRRWLLIAALYNQAEPDAAWKVFEEGDGLSVETDLEAQLWIALHARYRPSRETTSRALELAQRFDDDANLRAVAVNAFLLMGDDKGDVAPDELAEWHELIRLRAESPAPDDTFVIVSMPEDGDINALTEAFRPFLEPHQLQVDTWRERVRREGFPQGMLAVAAGRPYTKTLAHRPVGCIPMASSDPTTIAAELAAAKAALGGHVLVDNSALVVANYIRGVWPRLVGAFSKVEITAEAHRDAAISSDVMKPRSTETLGWDSASGQPTIDLIDDAILDKLEEQLAWITSQAATLSVRPSLTPGEKAETDDLGAWMATFHAAQLAGVPLWADDVGLRALARNEGVAAFGTDALLAALVAAGGMSALEHESILVMLRDAYCVDLPPNPEWLVASAEADDWRPGPALLVLSRPPAWSDLREGYETWSALAERAAERDPDRLPAWVYAAVTGIASAARDPEMAGRLTAGSLVKAATITAFNPSVFARCAQAAAQAASDSGVVDPTELALAMTMDLLAQRLGPEGAASTVAKLGSQLADDHREALRRILFGL